MKTKALIIILSFWLIALAVLAFSDSDRGEYDCSDFKSQGEAQKVFNKYATDVYHLDGDHDGKPCEMLK